MKNLDKNLYGMLAPLQKKGDSMTIGIPGGESVTIKFEDKKYFKPKKKGGKNENRKEHKNLA